MRPLWAAEHLFGKHGGSYWNGYAYLGATLNTTTRELAVASAGGYPGYKRPVLYVNEGARCWVIASFKSAEALEQFMELCPMFRPKEVEVDE